MGSNKRQCYLVMNIIKHCWYLIHVERQKETVRVYALMSQMKTIITTLVATIFRQFGRRFELFDITGLIQYTYIVVKSKMYLHSLRNRLEKHTKRLAFLLFSKAGTNKIYIFRQCTYIVLYVSNIMYVYLFQHSVNLEITVIDGGFQGDTRLTTLRATTTISDFSSSTRPMHITLTGPHSTR